MHLLLQTLHCWSILLQFLQIAYSGFSTFLVQIFFFHADITVCPFSNAITGDLQDSSWFRPVQLWSTSKLRRAERRLNAGLLPRMVCAPLNDECQKWRKYHYSSLHLFSQEAYHAAEVCWMSSKGFLQGWSQLCCGAWYRSDGCALSMAFE